MTFGTLNPEIIWHENLTDLSASPVRCSHLGKSEVQIQNVNTRLLPLLSTIVMLCLLFPVGSGYYGFLLISRKFLSVLTKMNYLIFRIKLICRHELLEYPVSQTLACCKAVLIKLKSNVSQACSLSLKFRGLSAIVGPSCIFSLELT